MSNVLATVLDYADKFFKRFKALGYIIAIIVLIIYLFNNNFETKKAVELAEKITGLNISNDLLLNQNKALDNALSIKDSLLAVKDFKIDSVSAEEKQDEIRTAYWKGEHGKIAEALIEITSDSSYRFTQEVYNYSGEKKYGYNAPQVKAIHRTYLENENKVEQIEALTASLFDCKSKTELMDEVIEVTKSKLMIYKEKEENLEKVLDNKEEAIKLYKKARRKKIWDKLKPWLALGGGILIGSL